MCVIYDKDVGSTCVPVEARGPQVLLLCLIPLKTGSLLSLNWSQVGSQQAPAILHSTGVPGDRMASLAFYIHVGI